MIYCRGTGFTGRSTGVGWCLARVVDFEILPLEEVLGRPRVDVTLKFLAFFDAF